MRVASNAGETCDHCGSERTLGRCWRLTCPVNGGNYKLLRLVRTEREEEGRLI